MFRTFFVHFVDFFYVFLMEFAFQVRLSLSNPVKSFAGGLIKMRN